MNAYDLRSPAQNKRPARPLFVCVVALWTGLFFSGGCGLHHVSNTQRKLIQRSLPATPAWVTTLPTDAEYFFALGMSTNASSLSQGRIEAARQALGELTAYVGVSTRTRFEMAETTGLATRIIDELQVRTSATLSNSSLSHMYYEEFHHAGTEESPSVYDVYILLRIPMADILQERLRQQEKRKHILAEVEATDKEAQGHLAAGNFQLAWQKWILAMRLLDGVSDDEVAALQLYKTVLTAVEGIELSWTAEQLHPTKAMQSPVPLRVMFSGDTVNTPLRNLPIEVQRIEQIDVVETKKTDVAGRVEYAFTSAPPTGLEARLSMASYRVNYEGLSDALSQSIVVLERMLRGKVARYGIVATEKDAEVVASAQSLPEDVAINVAASNSYLQEGAGEKRNLTIKVDLMPMRAQDVSRAPLNLSVVIDKSSSMSADGKMDYTKEAVSFLIDQLSPKDSLSIIAYSSGAQMVVPAGPVSFKALLKHHVSEISPNGMTNLSSGLFVGYREVRKGAVVDGINRILLLSDGIANQGIVRSAEFIPYAKEFAAQGVAVTTLGVGAEYNDDLLKTLAEYSQGNYYHIRSPQDIPKIFLKELNRLISVAAQNVVVSVKLAPGVTLLNAFNHPYDKVSANEYLFRHGDLGAKAILLMQLNVPAAQGKQYVATLEVRYGRGERRKQKSQKVWVTYTADATLLASGENEDVERFRLLTHCMEQLERALESQDNALYVQAAQDLQETYSTLEAYARKTEDPEFLERMIFLKHFREELETLRTSASLHGHEELKKKLGYQLYLQKHVHEPKTHSLHP